MATTKEDIAGWIKKGKDKGSKFLIIACDTFEYEDYPVFCKDADECKIKYAKCNGHNMQKVLEVYDLSKDTDLPLRHGKSMEVPW